jgi:cell division protein FtsI (penicillin-binding protein 3)
MSVTTYDRLPPASRRIRMPGRAGRALEVGRVRLLMTALMFALGFAAVAGRLVTVTLLQGEDGPGPARTAAVASDSSRAEIVDRNGVLLATSLPTPSLYADATLVPDAEAAIEQLSAILPDFNAGRARMLLATDRRFVWLHRHLTPRQQYRINRLGIPGLAFQTEERRFHPLGNVAAHVVGFTDVDGRGLAGIERSFDETLSAGEPVRLSIDVRLQEVMRAELQAAIEEFRAIGGAGLVMDANTGEILAMVSLPDFNPYAAGRVPEETRFNRTTLGVYEMGSTFKIFTTAMALDTGIADVNTMFDATRPIRVGRFAISDYHAEARWLSVAEVFRYSSNIGAVQMALAVGTPRQQEYLRRLGLLDPAPVELSEVGAPLVPSPWREINTMTISFGHGLSVSPVQLVSAVGAVVNGGVLHRPTLLRRDEQAPAGERVLAPQTSDTMRRLLRLVVAEGTGRRADAEGYLVGGKTGTAEKTQGRGYNRRALLSSFVAAFPMHRPEYVVLAMLDEPQGTAETYGYATGGWVAAPVVRRVVERIGPMLGVTPVDADAEDIRGAMRLGPGQADADTRMASFTRQ